MLKHLSVYAAKARVDFVVAWYVLQFEEFCLVFCCFDLTSSWYKHTHTSTYTRTHNNFITTHCVPHDIAPKNLQQHEGHTLCSAGSDAVSKRRYLYWCLVVLLLCILLAFAIYTETQSRIGECVSVCLCAGVYLCAVVRVCLWRNALECSHSFVIGH